MKRWVIISIGAAAFVLLLVAIVMTVQTTTDDAKFVVGKPLPAGKVTPQLVIDYMGRAAMLAPDGSLWAWGGDPAMSGGFISAIPMSSPTNMVPAPRKISDDTDWKKMSLWQGGVVALKNDGSLWTWSNNGTRNPATAALPKFVTPTRIGSDSDWAEISGNVSHFMALKTDGSLWGWGQNESGQIGNGTVWGGGSQSTTPLAVGTDHDWKTISAGSFNGYALKQDGTLWGWGSDINSSGTNQTNVLFPHQIDSGTNWVAISTGDYHLLALKSDGTIWIRGQNVSITAPGTYASIAYSNIDRSVLKQVGTDSDWEQMVSGQNCFFVRKKDGSWWACGSNPNYHLGLGAPPPPTASKPGGQRGPAFIGMGGIVGRGQNVAAPQRLPFDFDPWAMASGGPSTLLLTKDGSLWSIGTRLGVSQSGLGAKGIKGLYNSVVAWIQKKMHPDAQTPAGPAGPAGRGRLGRGGRGGPGMMSAPNDVVIDYSPYRVWKVPSDMRAALEKNASGAASPAPAKKP